MKVTLFKLHSHLFGYDLHVALCLLRIVEVPKSMYIWFLLLSFINENEG